MKKSTKDMNLAEAAGYCEREVQKLRIKIEALSDDPKYAEEVATYRKQERIFTRNRNNLVRFRNRIGSKNIQYSDINWMEEKEYEVN